MSKSERPQVLIGERVLWLGSGSGLPKSGKVKWIGRLPEMGPDWNIGLELDNPLPYGGIDGDWGNRKLFQCRAKHGLIVPLTSVIQPPKHAKASDELNSSRESAQGTVKSHVEHKFQRQFSLESTQEEDDDVFLSAAEDSKEPTIIISPTSSGVDSPTSPHFPRSPVDVAFNRRLSTLGTLRPHQAKSARLHIQSYLDGFLVDENQNARRRDRGNKKMIHGKGPFRRGTENLEKQSSVSSSRSSGSRKERSSIFSIFRWFKKERNSDSDSDSPPFPSSPVLRRVDRSVSGSVDTLFSTATANSFSFVSPSYYRPYGGAQPPDVRISSNEPDTTSYRRRIRQRDIRRLTERNISLKEKYRLYASGTLPGSADRINELSKAYDEIAASCSGKSSSLGRKKRKAPPPPQVNGASTSDDNLPLTIGDSQVKQHRRTNSEPVKYVKGACHVKGKRKAPPPPLQLNLNNSSLSLRRRKRNAPPPPDGTVANFDSEESASTASTIDVSQVDVVSTDTLKLERGILKPNKMERPVSAEPKFTPSSPVSPRPWYKRTSRADQFGKSSERKKEKERRRVEDWMLESGFPRFTINSPNEQKHNIFTKIERPEDKRKSAISILTNISELDREAAEIVQKGRAMEEAISATHDAMFYSKNEVSPFSGDQEGPSRMNSTRELITLFNAITNTTRETVNPAFVTKNEIFDGKKVRESKENGLHQVILDEQEIRITDSPQPGPSSDGNEGPSKIAKVTIEELDAFDAERNSKAQALYEANRLNRPRSPPIPTIAEVAEGSSSAKSNPPPVTSLGAVGIVGSASSRELVWVCPRCTLENSRWKLICEACDKWRPIPCEFTEQKQKSNSSKEPLPVLKIVEPKDKEPTKKDTTGQCLTITGLLFKTNSDDAAVSGADASQSVVTVERATAAIDRTQGAAANEITHTVKTKGDNTVSDGQEDTELNIEPDMFSQKVSNEPKIENKLETEEVRKARIAFFNKILESSKENNLSQSQEEKESNLQIDSNTSHNLLDKKETFKNIQTITEFPYEPKLTNNSIEDKQKLKEMLKEMKHSLPKRSKETKITPSEPSKENAVEKSIGGARPKVFQQTQESYKHAEPEKAEAYLVESQTVIEEIKIRKPAEKVSSSAQTSALVRQIASRVKPPSGREYIVPITVRETSIKDGVLYTSVSKQVKKIGSGTFELLRPRDFANIEAVKSKSAAPAHLYANMPDVQMADSSTTNEFEQLTHQLTDARGIASFKAGLATRQEGNSMNTMSLNRLLRRLENAIASGQHELAASLAKELAHMKVNCCVTRQKSEASSSQILVEMYVEDKINHQGPIPIKVQPLMTVKQLKVKVEHEYEIPVGVQRWILGRVLASDDSATLESLGVTTEGCPIFLYLVAPEIVAKKEPEGATALEVNDEEEYEKQENVPFNIDENKAENENKPFPFGTLALGWKCSRCTLVNSPTRPGCAACGSDRPKNYEIPKDYNVNQAERERIDREKVLEEEAAQANEDEKKRHYQKLVDLEKDDLILCTEPLECPVCFVDYEPLVGVVLRECLHAFCKPCLQNTVRYSDEAEVKCPFRDENYTCDSTLLEREIKALVTPEVYEEHLAKSIALAETKIGNAFHCKTPDCKGWCIYEDNVNTFNCPVCTHTNCLTCQAIHEGLNCKQFQERIHQDSDTNVESKRTKEMLQEMVERGEAMNCPTCQVILMKKWGCDWLRCSMCKTEICWITRGARWGPNGKGDTSAGCQCGVNGIKCHPKCTYCH